MFSFEKQKTLLQRITTQQSSFHTQLARIVSHAYALPITGNGRWGQQEWPEPIKTHPSSKARSSPSIRTGEGVDKQLWLLHHSEYLQANTLWEPHEFHPPHAINKYLAQRVGRLELGVSTSKLGIRKVSFLCLFLNSLSPQVSVLFDQIFVFQMYWLNCFYQNDIYLLFF